jgi:hypothetical protein
MSKPEDRPGPPSEQLADAIAGLTSELAAQREERQRGLVTKQDLAEAEQRIIAAIANQFSAADFKSLEKIEGRIARLATRLKKLDAQTG